MTKGEKRMATTVEQLGANSRIGMEALIALANSHFAVYEKLAALNFSTSRSMFEDGINYAKAVMNAKNPQELAQISVGATPPILERMISYSRSLYQLASESQTEFANLFQGQTGRLNQSVAGVFESISRNAAASSEAAVAVTKSALDATTSAQDGFAKAAQEAAKTAERSVSDAANVAQETASRALKQASGAADQPKKKAT
jgi:phasin family protein